MHRNENIFLFDGYDFKNLLLEFDQLYERMHRVPGQPKESREHLIESRNFSCS